MYSKLKWRQREMSSLPVCKEWFTAFIQLAAGLRWPYLWQPITSLYANPFSQHVTDVFKLLDVLLFNVMSPEKTNEICLISQMFLWAMRLNRVHVESFLLLSRLFFKEVCPYIHTHIDFPRLNCIFWRKSQCKTPWLLPGCCSAVLRCTQ